MEKHIDLAAYLHIGLGILGILAGAFLLFFFVGIGFAVHDETAFMVLTILGTSLGIFLFMLSIPGIIGGFGLLKRKSWSRVLMLILATVELIDIPLGTAVGVYTFWVLLQDDALKAFTQ